MPRLRILISAHELSPIQGSECAEGWNLTTRLAKYHDVTVLYADGSQFEPGGYKKAVERFQSSNVKMLENVDQPCFVAIPQPKLTLRLARINQFLSRRETGIGIRPLYYWGYKMWQKAAYKKAKELHNRTHFNLVHHLTQITFREPGYMWKLGIPFVWGPTGGLQNVPIQFALDRGFRIGMTETARNNINILTSRLVPRIRHAIKTSSLIYAFSLFDKNLFNNQGAMQVELMLDAGSKTSNIRNSAFDSQVLSPESLKVIWVGQIVERKALDILIEAIRGSMELVEKTKVTVVGGGPLLKQCKRRVSRLSQFRRLDWTFTGQILHEEVTQLMNKADVLVHTSYREAATNVIPEALSVGLPVICHDISGMSIAIDETCGIKIPLESHKISVEGFRNALLTLTENRGPNTKYHENLRKGANSRAQSLSWDRMAKQIADDYTKLVG